MVLVNNNNNNINNNNSNGFEYYSNGCASANKQQMDSHCIDDSIIINKELIQVRANKCKQTQARTNNVVYHLSASNGSHLTPSPGNHQLAHVINSLSSPESAYSTGYSTDGTSPGKC